jgi:hypothetical protein
LHDLSCVCLKPQLTDAPLVPRPNKHIVEPSSPSLRLEFVCLSDGTIAGVVH